jgi:hypothetical protein
MIIHLFNDISSTTITGTGSGTGSATIYNINPNNYLKILPFGTNSTTGYSVIITPLILI